MLGREKDLNKISLRLSFRKRAFGKAQLSSFTNEEGKEISAFYPLLQVFQVSITSSQVFYQETEVLPLVSELVRYALLRHPVG